MRIALGVAYDGAPYAGWQTQPHGRTLQDVLEGALAQFADEPVATTCAGRTDAGVHAVGQVVHFDTTRERALQGWVRGVNRYLPGAIAVQWACTVTPEFHARYSARARHYDYWILNHPVRAPLLHGRVGWVFRPLDVAAMQAAATAVVGTHDFSSFRSAECQARSPERTMSRCEVQRAGSHLVRVRASANAFLHHMVRNLVGALVEVGTGRRSADWMAELLAARDRRLGAPTMDAAGLVLSGVDYDEGFGLPKFELGKEPWTLEH